MSQRLDFYNASPEAMHALLAFDRSVSSLGIDKQLADLVKLRASQINGCAYCVDVHAGDLRKAGLDERRLQTLLWWRDTPFFTEKERAALAWTEAVTRISETHAPDEDYEAIAGPLSEKERVDLTLVIGLINVWNRLSIGFRKAPALEK